MQNVVEEPLGRNINAIFAKVPFPQLNSTSNIETWFIKMEAWFELQGLGIRKEVEKYKAVIAYLDQKYLDQVHDLVRTQPIEQPYTTLKQAILARFAESEMARLDKLAHGIQLGDGRPSHLLSQLQRVNATNDESVVRRYWIKRLPPNVRCVVAGMLESNQNISLSQLAITADAILDSISYSSGDHVSSIATSSCELSDNSVCGVSSSNNRLGTLEKRMDKTDVLLQQIDKKLSQLVSGYNNNSNHPRQRGRSQSSYRRASTPSRQVNQDDDSSPYCWYHTEYGTDAKKCIKPCDFSRENS